MRVSAAKTSQYRSSDAAMAIVPILALLLVLTLFARRSISAQVSAQGSAQSRNGDSLVVRSSDFLGGGAIPKRYTCDGGGISPNLQWSTAPNGTRSFALVMHDPDAPGDFTHWLAYNIPSGIHELGEGASAGRVMPAGSSEGMNGFGRTGYGGPCPPAGPAHRYVFHLYALDSGLDLPAGIERSRLESAMKPHILGGGEIVGHYGR